MEEKDWGGNKRTTYAQLGASNHSDGEREVNDFYATDSVAIDKLTKVFDIPQNIIEISAGNGHLSKRLKELGHNVLSYDLVKRDYPLDKMQDFLKLETLPENYNILTNPPFLQINEFIQHLITNKIDFIVIVSDVFRYLLKNTKKNLGIDIWKGKDAQHFDRPDGTEKAIHCGWIASFQDDWKENPKISKGDV